MQFVSHPSQLEVVVQSEGGEWAEESLFSEHSGNHSEGGRYFSIYKNAELAGFFSYALSDICLRECCASFEGMCILSSFGPAALDYITLLSDFSL